MQGEFIPIPWTLSAEWSSIGTAAPIKDFQAIRQKVDTEKVRFIINPVIHGRLKRIARRAVRKARMRMLNRRKS